MTHSFSKSVGRISTLAVAVAMCFLPTGCRRGDAKVPDVITDEYTTVEDNSDPAFIQYADSLKMFFGPMEVDLLKQYKRNHENLKSQQDFVTFFSNANTLKAALKRTLQEHADSLRNKENVGKMPELDFFNKSIAKGLIVYTILDGKTYDIKYDFTDLTEYAGKTEGLQDDDYIKLYQLSYSPEDEFPLWLEKTPNNLIASNLGDGHHLNILKQADFALQHGDLFRNKIRRLRTMVMNDIAYSRLYALPKAKAIAELRQIINEVKMEDNEAALLRKRLDELASGKNIQFECTSGKCTAPDSSKE